MPNRVKAAGAGCVSHSASIAASLVFCLFFEGRLRIQSDGCLIYLSEDGSVTEIRQNTAEQYSEEELTALAASLVASGKSRGWPQYFKYRLVSFTDASGASQKSQSIKKAVVTGKKNLTAATTFHYVISYDLIPYNRISYSFFPVSISYACRYFSMVLSTIS